MKVNCFAEDLSPLWMCYRVLPAVHWLWYLKSLTSTGDGTTKKSRSEVVAEWATTGNLSHRWPRPWGGRQGYRVQLQHYNYKHSVTVLNEHKEKLKKNKNKTN